MATNDRRAGVAFVRRLDAADDDVGRALPLDVFQGVVHGAFAERHQRDDRRRADDDAEHRQEGPQLVQPQAADGQHKAPPALVPIQERRQHQPRDLQGKQQHHRGI